MWVKISQAASGDPSPRQVESPPAAEDDHVSNQKKCVFTTSHLVLTSHNDVFWFRHHAALLGHQGVPLRAGQAVGGEEAIVLLHAHGGSGQLTTGAVYRQGTPAGAGLTFTHSGPMRHFCWDCICQACLEQDVKLTHQEVSCTPELQKLGVQQICKKWEAGSTIWQIQDQTVVFPESDFCVHLWPVTVSIVFCVYCAESYTVKSRLERWSSAVERP